MNYKVHFENNMASKCEHVKNINDTADYVTINNMRVIKSLVVNASNEKDAFEVANRLANKLKGI